MIESNRIKISSDFLYAKISVSVTILFLLPALTDYKRTDTDVLVEYIIMFIVLSVFLIYIFTRPAMSYDPQTLYIAKGKETIKIPFKKIQSIAHSIVGFGLSAFSYKIKYVGEDETVKSCRVMPAFWGSSVPKFIDCIEKENPATKIKRGVLG